MKAFFEEYGLVLVVTVIVAGMLTVSGKFEKSLDSMVTTKWQAISNHKN